MVSLRSTSGSGSNGANAPGVIRVLLDRVFDPEIPTLTIAELGILRETRVVGDMVTVVITPTYSGCPAMDEIEFNIKKTLADAGHETVCVEVQLMPPWSTAWITPSGREKLRTAGIAPPSPVLLDESGACGHVGRPYCPRCAALDSELVSQFGTTACKALYRCNSCLEPFEYFKCI